jgi:adenylate cyclase
MSQLSDNIESDVNDVIDTTWNKRRSNQIPNTQQVALSGGAVEVAAIYLYSDLAKSSQMARDFDRRVTAKILKSFLATSVRLIRARGGRILSFDGDRVMGAFVGDYKNSNAAKCALNINYAVLKVIRPKFERKYQSVREAGFRIQHCTGVDTGEVLIVRAGARGSNDLISIGRAPNLAAKLSDIRENPYNTIITSSVYLKLSDESKYAKKDGESVNMWQQRSWGFLDDNLTLYRSNYSWKP